MLIRGCKRATVQIITRVCYTSTLFILLGIRLHNDIFLTGITGYNRLKFS